MQSTIILSVFCEWYLFWRKLGCCLRISDWRARLTFTSIKQQWFTYTKRKTDAQETPGSRRGGLEAKSCPAWVLTVKCIGKHARICFIPTSLDVSHQSVRFDARVSDLNREIHQHIRKIWPVWRNSVNFNVKFSTVSLEKCRHAQWSGALNDNRSKQQATHETIAL